MRLTFKITIKSGKTKLHSAVCDFNTVAEAQTYSLGLCEGFRLSGMNPNIMILKEIKD